MLTLLCARVYRIEWNNKTFIFQLESKFTKSKIFKLLIILIRGLGRRENKKLLFSEKENRHIFEQIFLTKLGRLEGWLVERNSRNAIT